MTQLLRLKTLHIVPRHWLVYSPYQHNKPHLHFSNIRQLILFFFFNVGVTVYMKYRYLVNRNPCR